MLKPENVPDAAAFALDEARRDPDASPWHLIAAALNAWPGASRESDQLGGNWHRVILPLTEASNDT